MCKYLSGSLESGQTKTLSKSGCMGLSELLFDLELYGFCWRIPLLLHLAHLINTLHIFPKAMVLLAILDLESEGVRGQSLEC